VDFDSKSVHDYLIDCWLHWLQLQGVGSVEGVSASHGNKSDLVTQCENLRDVVRKAEVQQIIIAF